MRLYAMFFRFPYRRTVGTIFFLTLILLSSFFLASWWKSPPDYIFKHPYFLFDVDLQEPRTPGQKCILPRIHPFHPSIWAYLKFQKGIFCKQRQPDLTYIDSAGRLVFNNSEVQGSGYEIGISLLCHWSPVLRDPPDGDDKISYGNEVHLPKQGYQLPPEVSVIRVLCKSYSGFSVYEKILAHIHVSKPKSTANIKHPINIIIFGLDSMSRLSFIRHLPQTYRYLTEDLNMTVLRGMNKVGDNTFPNLIPVLTGHKAYGDGLGDTSGYYDHWPLIWKNFSNSGYGTLWAEDFIEYGLFNYLAKGFHKPPTDAYMRPYWLAIENTNLLKISSYMCYGSYPKYFVQLDYLKRFLTAHEKSKTPYFAFSFLAEVSHEYTTRISSADLEFKSYLSNIKKDGQLDNTVMIVMSDHGHRFDSIRTTQVGHIEERMPFYSIYIPHRLSVLQPTAKEVLRQNSGRLVTPFDIYATLMDIFHLSTSDRPLGLPDPESERLGQTLFREVPLDRTCADAFIPVQYCTCQTDSAISVTDPRVQTAAETTVWSINELLEDAGQLGVCVVRTLRTIRSANLVHIAGETQENGDKIRVMIETDPSGVFEALVEIQNDVAAVLGEVSRISPYRFQSDCIQHVILRKFCYCANHLEKKYTT